MAWIKDNRVGVDRTDDSYEVIAIGQTPVSGHAADLAEVGAWRDSGATWWMESFLGERLVDIEDRLRAGPPDVRVGLA